MTKAQVFRADLYGLREGKYKALWETDVSTTEWEEVRPQTPFYLFAKRDEDLAAEYEQEWKITNISPVNSVGIATSRDRFVIGFDSDEVGRRIATFCDYGKSEDELRRMFNLKDNDKFKLGAARKRLCESDWSSDIVPIHYRPFDVRQIIYRDEVLERPRPNITSHILNRDNLALITSRLTKGETFQHAQMTRNISEVICMSPKTSNNGFVFPLYLYPDGSSLFETDTRRPNLAPEFIAELAAKVGLEFIPDGKGDLERTFGPEDVFHYIYAVFHAPSYRERYAEFLKIDFPRVPLTSSLELFRTLAAYGETLVALHLMERVGSPISSYPVDGDNVVDKVSFAENEDGKTGRVYINKTQYFDGVPLTVWNFYVGGYQVLQKWLKDRKGRTLSYDDLRHYGFVVSALFETISTMREIDVAVAAGGGWPLS